MPYLKQYIGEGTEKGVVAFRGSQYSYLEGSMKIKKQLLFWALGNKTNIKAVSLLIALKRNLGKTSSLENASQNRIAAAAGVSPNTIKKYLPILERLGFIEWRGKHHDVLVVNKISTRTRHRNIDISRIIEKSYKKIYENLRSFLFLLILSCKSFVKRVIQIANTSKDSEEVKSALKSCNRYAKRNDQKLLEYREWGISFSKIGQKIGFCKRVAEDIVNLAIKKRWCTKQRNYEWYSMPGVNRMYVEGFTFTTMDYGFVVHANTYSVNRCILMALIDGKN